MSFQARCPHCGKTVTAFVHSRDAAKRALNENKDIEIFHSTGVQTEGDHRWLLPKEDTPNLRKVIESGELDYFA